MFENNEKYVPLNSCLACGKSELSPVLDLGTQPLANSYRDSKEDILEEYSLAINRCKSCNHVQLTHAVNPEHMFVNYAYMSGVSKTWLEHCVWFADYTSETFFIYKRGYPTSVLDIGSNDGSQLDAFKKLGSGTYSTFGVDPAKNLAGIARNKGHVIYDTFFDTNFILDHDDTYDVISAQNVFAHNYDPVTFLKCAKKIMNQNSLLFIQTSQSDMIKNGEFDTIYHEHINFFNISSMNEICRRAGLFLLNVTKCPLHGNSYIFIISKNGMFARPANIFNLIEMEKKAGLYSDETCDKFSLKAEKFHRSFNDIIHYYRNEGYAIVGYGAAAKGMTVLNYTGVDLDFIVDDTPLKQNKYTPGRDIPIKSIQALIDMKDDKALFIPLAWNYFDEIRNKILPHRPGKKDTYLKIFPEMQAFDAKV